MNKTIRYNTDREWENYIQEMRIDRGMSFRELAERSGINMTQVCQLANGMTSPIYQVKNSATGFKKGEIKPWVIRLCIVLNVQPEIMFPREICPLEDPKIKGLHKTQIDAVCLSSYSQRGMDDILKSNYLKRFIWRYIIKTFWFKKVPKGRSHPRMYKRMVQVIHMRFLCGMTLDETGLKIGLSKERVRQTECKILRFMRQPSFANVLKKHVEIAMQEGI